MPVRVMIAVAIMYCHGGKNVSAHQGGIAAAVPAVPGATGKYPAPKKLDQVSATNGAGPLSPGIRRGFTTTRGAATAGGPPSSFTPRTPRRPRRAALRPALRPLP